MIDRCTTPSIVIGYEALTCAAGDSESATVTTTLKVPATVGTPEIIPPVDRLNPTGSEEPGAGAHFHVYGALPPEAESARPLSP